MKKTKSVPAIVTLLGCAVTVILTYINGYELEKTLKILLAVFFIFLFMGLFIKHLFEKYIPPIEEETEAEADEGSVIEKTAEDGSVVSDDGSLVQEMAASQENNE